MKETIEWNIISQRCYRFLNQIQKALLKNQCGHPPPPRMFLGQSTVQSEVSLKHKQMPRTLELSKQDLFTAEACWPSLETAGQFPWLSGYCVSMKVPWGQHSASFDGSRNSFKSRIQEVSCKHDTETQMVAYLSFREDKTNRKILKEVKAEYPRGTSKP